MLLLLLVMVLGCVENGPTNGAVAPSEPPPEEGGEDVAIGEIVCVHDHVRCRRAQARLRAIEGVLSRLDCTGGGDANPEQCAAQQNELRRERLRIRLRWGGERSGGGSEPGERDGRPTEMSSPNAGGEGAQRSRLSPRRNGDDFDGGDEKMDIEVSDE